MNYWLIKSEPSCFSIDDLQQCPQQINAWDGVRNYQARNYLRDGMKLDDLVLFYHSNCKIPGIVGIVKVVSTSYPDYTAFDPTSEHPDLTSTVDNPRWFMVDVQFVKKFAQTISLTELKQQPELCHWQLIKKGNRLSVLPVSECEWLHIISLAI